MFPESGLEEFMQRGIVASPSHDGLLCEVTTPVEEKHSAR